MTVPGPKRSNLAVQTVRSAWRRSESDAEASRRLGVSQSTFYAWRSRLGLPNCHGAALDKWWVQYRDTVLGLWGMRQTEAWLASDLGISIGRLRSVMERFGVPSRYIDVGEKLRFLADASPKAHVVVHRRQYKHAQEPDDSLVGFGEWLTKPPAERRPLVPPPPARESLSPAERTLAGPERM